MNLLSEAHLGRIESHLAGVLHRVFDAECVGSLNEMIRAYVREGGKRIRPQLCVWTYERAGVGDQGLGVRDGALLDLACGWELFHAFLLVHDDIIDHSDTRRGRLSLHRQLASLDGNADVFGVNLGIVAGDLLFSGAMKLWHGLDLPGDVYRDVLRVISRITTTTGFGQAIDICQSHADVRLLDERLLLKEYHWKTAAYTFEGPMVSGAILAGVNQAGLRAISTFALSLGQAYQLQNDLIDLSQPSHEGSDLVQGKRTIAMVRARAGMSEKRRGDFDRRVMELQHANGEAVGLAEGLRRELCECGAMEKTGELIGEFLSEARTAANDRAIPKTMAAGMSELLAALTDQYFTTPELPAH